MVIKKLCRWRWLYAAIISYGSWRLQTKDSINSTSQKLLEVTDRPSDQWQKPVGGTSGRAAAYEEAEKLTELVWFAEVW